MRRKEEGLGEEIDIDSMYIVGVTDLPLCDEDVCCVAHARRHCAPFSLRSVRALSLIMIPVGRLLSGERHFSLPVIHLRIRPCARQ